MMSSSSSISSNPELIVASSWTSRAEIDLKYRLLAVIGQGSFAKVRRAVHRLTNLEVAIKIISRRKIFQEQLLEKVVREVRMMKLLRHPHIVRLYEVIETPDELWIVMELATRGDLCDYLIQNNRLEEGEARWFFQQLIAGVDYCHRKLVIHRDLKAENLLLDSQRHLKIADFGLCNMSRQGSFLRTSCGSTNYAAPEVLSGRPYEGPEVDVWSCGVILYALLCGRLPFDDESMPVLFSKIRTGVYTIPLHVPQAARLLITRMLTVDPRARITIAEIKEHPWVRLHLPQHLVSPYTIYSRIDAEVLSRVVVLGFNREQVILDLQQNSDSSAGAAAYYILLTHHRQISAGFEQ